MAFWDKLGAAFGGEKYWEKKAAEAEKAEKEAPSAASGALEKLEKGEINFDEAGEEVERSISDTGRERVEKAKVWAGNVWEKTKSGFNLAGGKLKEFGLALLAPDEIIKRTSHETARAVSQAGGVLTKGMDWAWETGNDLVTFIGRRDAENAEIFYGPGAQEVIKAYGFSKDKVSNAAEAAKEWLIGRTVAVHEAGGAAVENIDSKAKKVSAWTKEKVESWKVAQAEKAYREAKERTDASLKELAEKRAQLERLKEQIKPLAA